MTALDAARPSLASLVARIVPTTPSDEWDAFVAATPGGSIEQTTRWAEAKRRTGMRTALVTVSDDDRLMAGAVVQIRSIAPAVSVGFVPHGPLLGASDGHRWPAVVAALVDAARALGVRALVVQPPAGAAAAERELVRHGFFPSPLAVATEATIELDLTRSFAELSAGLSSSRRHAKRLASMPLRIREATTSDDVTTFHRLYLATAARQRFVPVELACVRAQWEELHPAGLLRLFVAEHDGEAVASQTATFFGDTVTPRLSGWTGGDRALRAPELLDWWLVQRAKDEGFRRFDFGGIAREYALGVTGTGAAAPQPTSALKAAHPTSYYKHSFGGDVVVLPPPYLHVVNALARPLARFASPRLARSVALRRRANRWKSG